MDNTPNNKTQSLVCPECDTPLNLPKEFVVGKIIECDACGTESEIVTTNPLKLSPLEEEK